MEFVLRRAAGGEGDRHCEAESRATSIMRCRSSALGARGALALERLDDDHPTAATRTAPRRRNVFSLTSSLGAGTLGRGVRHGERLASALDVAGANRSCEQAVMADAVSAHKRHKSLILLDAAGDKNIVPRFLTSIRRARRIS
jgi:hypothetical protein